MDKKRSFKIRVDSRGVQIRGQSQILDSNTVQKLMGVRLLNKDGDYDMSGIDENNIESESSISSPTPIPTNDSNPQNDPQL